MPFHVEISFQNRKKLNASTQSNDLFYRPYIIVHNVILEQRDNLKQVLKKPTLNINHLKLIENLHRVLTSFNLINPQKDLRRDYILTSYVLDIRI